MTVAKSPSHQPRAPRSSGPSKVRVSGRILFSSNPCLRTEKPLRQGSLIVSERVDRVEPRGAACGYVAGKCGDGCEQEHGRKKRQWVASLESEQQGSGRAYEREGTGNP